MLFQSDLQRKNDLGKGIMEGALARFVIPIQREDEVIGIILLESKSLQSLPDDELEFLIRLSDHAAIAIANAQLFLEIKAANLAKSEFVSFVSHELKTPMTSIKGFADLLAAGAVGPINDVQNNFLSTIRSNVDRMATLVSDLSDVSRIEAGRIRLEFESIPIKEILNEIVRSSNNQLENKNQSLRLEIEDQLPPLWGDRIRLIQIFTNLVSNANKYSPLNSQITISAEQCKNVWDSGGCEKVIHIAIKDHGYGISPDDQEKIFEKFFRADDPNIREVSGTGLGLNITRTLVEMQGGKIWFESKFNEGTTFHFTVPVSEGN
jgi:signal transduction histidine kinase